MQSGGPFFQVELGRLDGLNSTAGSVPGQLPEPNQTMDQLLAVFKAHGLNMSDLVALSAARRGSGALQQVREPAVQLPAGAADGPTLNPKYARFLEQSSPAQFDNQYYRNLQDGGGLLGSDELLYTDNRTRAMVDSLANSTDAFYKAFADAIVRLSRVGVKSGRRGNIRKQCDVFN
ncbi:unnamed protein product [Miscanthus lutarioriparius]|uniref:Plant heme peroxidase family profile domain-containing protein n=1 Tax=Miscanthus lutarioriparius TaxID=422564 RepID=A0A811SNM8_9POAL|nr:unnamed protein product [Miscanthus lutarioriparius]